jgi:hypothetical protein
VRISEALQPVSAGEPLTINDLNIVNGYHHLITKL